MGQLRGKWDAPGQGPDGISGEDEQIIVADRVGKLLDAPRNFGVSFAPFFTGGS